MPPTAAAGAFALRLGKNDVILLAKAAGGSAFAPVITKTADPHTFAKKRLGPVTFEAFVIEVGPSTSTGLSTWIHDSWGLAIAPKDGAILVLDHALKDVAIREFKQAFITATMFPALEATAQELGRIKLHIDVGAVSETKGTGKPVSALGWKPKLWQASAFRLEIGGIDCTKVVRIDSFTVTRPLIGAAPVAHAATQRSAGPIHFPNLAIEISESGADSWIDWHREFVLKGKNADGDEREGAIVLLAPNLKSEIARIKLHHVGIAKLSQPLSSEGASGLRRHAEVYCESMELITDGGTA